MTRSILARAAAISLLAHWPLTAQTLPVPDAAAPASRSVSIDLGKRPTGLDLEQPLEIDRRTSISVVLLNAVPSAHYRVSVSVDDVPVGERSLSKASALPLPAGSVVHVLYGRLLEELDSAVDEASVARAAQRTVRDVERAYDSGGGFLLDSLEARTVHRLDAVASLRPGERLQVIVARVAPDGAESARWSTVFSTGPMGEWHIELGFVFPYIVGALADYSVRRDGEGHYRVRASDGDDRISLVPAVLFGWVARDERLDALTLSLSGGVGFDMQNPVVLLGGALSFHQNITIIAGAAAHRVPRLDSDYVVGDIVDERLGSDDLVAMRYRIDPFVGVGFRLLGSSLVK